ncbi:MAG: HAD family hydrolase [Deltaproteobacteria bacterium]|nr:HAD family hydrolase [Deltaproteobacteria bacterium]
MKPKSAVFFDRDGVLNQALVVEGKPYPPKDVESLVITPGARSLMMELKELGFKLISVTNQPDVARGTKTLENVQAINEKVSFELSLDDIFVCLHDDGDDCSCRKPKPGMLIAAAEKWNLDLPSSFMVGDRAGDVAAGRSAGCQTIFLDMGYKEPSPDPPADHSCRSLFEAVQIIKGVAIHERRARFESKVIR